MPYHFYCKIRVKIKLIKKVPISMPYEGLMTIDEVAGYLKVKKRTIYDWIKKGRIPAIKTIGQWRFKKDKIDQWLESLH